MTTQKTGGPAFPVADYDHQVFNEATVDETRRLLSGMTLRDYFAAKFMQGFIAAPDREDEYSHVTKDECAKRAYEMADAMLRARES